MNERGTTEYEVKKSIEVGEMFPAKFERTGYRCNFPFEGKWKGKKYNTKQVEAYAVKEGEDIVVVTVVVKYY